MIQEIQALIVAKRKLFLQELDMHDGRDWMNKDAKKWRQEVDFVMRVRYFLSPRMDLLAM